MKNIKRILAAVLVIMMIVPMMTVGMDAACSHKWKLTAEYPHATCTTEGWGTFTCEYCGATKQEVTPATGHGGGRFFVSGNSLMFTCHSCGKNFVEDTISDVNSNSALNVISGAFDTKNGTDYDCKFFPVSQVLTAKVARSDGSISFLGERPSGLDLPTIAVANARQTSFENAGADFVADYGFKYEPLGDTAYNNNICYVYTPQPITNLNDNWCATFSSRGIFDTVYNSGNGGLIINIGGTSTYNTESTNVTAFLIFPDGSWIRYDWYGSGFPAFWDMSKDVEIDFHTTEAYGYNEALQTYPYTFSINGQDMVAGATKAVMTTYPNGIKTENDQIGPFCDLTYFGLYMKNGYSTLVVPGSFENFWPNFTLHTMDGIAANNITPGGHTHSYTSAITTPATCTTAGVRTFTCSCGDSYTETIPATGHNYTSEVTTAATCGTAGVKTYTCSNCGDTYTETIPATGNHVWDAGVVTTAPTTTTTGVKTFTCTVCGATRTETIDMLDPQPVEGFTIVTDSTTATITGVTDVTQIRYAAGHYTTLAEIKSAAGNRSVSAGIAEGMTIEVPAGGEYTFYYRLADGNTGIVYATFVATPSCSVDGIYVNVNNILGASRVTVAPGHHTSATAAKKAPGAGSKTTTIEGLNACQFMINTEYLGEYTVAVTIGDQTYFLYTTIDIPVPEITSNGMTTTLDNLGDVYIVRYALGSYTTEKQIKLAPGAKSFRIASGRTSFDRFFAAEGTYTVLVKYRNGYTKYLTITIENTDPTFEVNGSTVTVGNLNGIDKMRFARGIFTSDQAIKNASGNKLVRASGITADGTYTATGLAAGTYTFYTYYTNLSSGYYTVTVG